MLLSLHILEILKSESTIFVLMIIWLKNYSGGIVVQSYLSYWYASYTYSRFGKNTRKKTIKLDNLSYRYEYNLYYIRMLLQYNILHWYRSWTKFFFVSNDTTFYVGVFLFRSIPIGWMGGEIWAPISIGWLFLVSFATTNRKIPNYEKTRT